MLNKAILLLVSTLSLLLLMWLYGYYAGSPASWDRLPATSINDTLYVPNKCDTTMMADSLKGKPFTEPEWNDAQKGTTQYRIWQQRKAQMKQLARKYASLQLPNDAHIIDEKFFATAHGQRVLLAWMTSLNINLDYGDGDEDEDRNMWWYLARGSGYFKGSLSFSLIDPVQKRIINTVNFTDYFESASEDDSFFYDEIFSTYPFAIADRGNDPIAPGSSLYHAIGANDMHDGAADVMHFFDFNGDGRSFEFLVYNKEASSIQNAALFGYNEKKDSFLNYSWYITSYNDVGVPKPYLFIHDIFDYPNDFSYIKRYGSGKLSVTTSTETRISIDEHNRFDSTCYRLTEKFDDTQYGELINYTYEIMRYDSTTDRYSIMNISLPLYNYLRLPAY